MKQKRHALTLIEVSIACVVLGGILFFVFSPFTETAKMTKKIESAIEVSFSHHNFQTRLTQLLDELAGEIKCSENALSFSTSIGIDPEKAFSSPLNAALSLTRDGDLTLKLSPKDDDENIREEILLRSVTSIDYTFHSLEEGKYKTEKVWDNSSPPDAITITINGSDKYAFHIAKTSGGIAL
ncbi:MAG: hypothetical protein P0S94_04440 [Simkaniaceae bacterium]|nr:hypothetical protein [Simkaniaceae bacterium]